jgi:cell division protein FtsN
MTVQGEGDTSLATSAGVEPKGRIDANKMPEAPVATTRGAAPATPPHPAQTKTAQQAAPTKPIPPAPAPTKVAQAAKPQPAPKPAPAKPAAKPAPAAAASGEGGGSIQLGAFSSQASAEKAWKALSGRFSYVAPLNHSVIPVSSGGRTLYRLRAGGAGAADVCQRLKVAGESCVSLD